MSQIVAFDVETPNRYNNRICSIGLTVINDGVITETLYYLINPEAEFDRTNIKIHGIKPNDVLDAPVFSDVWNDIREYFRSSLITAHNATFDLCVLRNTLQAYGISESKTNYVCTLQMAKNTIKDVENYRLPTLCKYAGIELKHHHALSDSYGCAELLRHFLNSGVTLDEYIKTFDFAVENKTNHSYRAKTLSNQNQSLKNLIDVLSAITCDGILVEEEIMFLQNWLDENRRLEGNYPYDKIFGTISNALADGVLQQHELDYMYSLFKQISNPIASLRCNYRTLDIENKNIVLTGDFDRGDRDTLEKELSSLGAICQKSVTRTTHYVIVGERGSSMWCAGNYGTKVKKALELQAKGIPIEIIREADFYNALGIDDKSIK